MEIGHKENHMSLKTRLDPRSEVNSSFTINNSNDELVAEITMLGEKGSTLEIELPEGLYISKPNGWSSKEKS